MSEQSSKPTTISAADEIVNVLKDAFIDGDWNTVEQAARALHRELEDKRNHVHELMMRKPASTPAERDSELETLNSIVCELVEELNWKERDDHHVLAIAALRAIGIPDADIKGYFAGNIILQDDIDTPAIPPAVDSAGEVYPEPASAYMDSFDFALVNISAELWYVPRDRSVWRDVNLAEELYADLKRQLAAAKKLNLGVQQTTDKIHGDLTAANLPLHDGTLRTRVKLLIAERDGLTRQLATLTEAVQNFTQTTAVWTRTDEPQTLIQSSLYTELEWVETFEKMFDSMQDARAMLDDKSPPNVKDVATALKAAEA